MRAKSALLPAPPQYLEVDQRSQVNDLVGEFSGIFAKQNELGLIHNTRATINSQQNSNIFRVSPTRPPRHLANEMKEQIQQMLSYGVIEKSSSPFCSRVHLVKKKNGTYRFVVDLRGVNERIQHNGAPLPHMDDIIHHMSAAKYMSTLDLKWGYWQVALEKDSRKFTAFAIENQLYQFTRLPFGLKTAPGIFQTVMMELIGDIPDVKVYLDDIVVASPSYDGHMESLREVFKRFAAAGVLLNPTKCQLFSRKANILGRDIDLENGTIKPNEDQLAIIRDSKPPSNTKDLKAWLGLSSWLSAYIRNYARISDPLYALLRKDNSGRPAKWQWGEIENIAFEEIRQSLLSGSMLALPDWTSPFTLATDASDRAVGYSLVNQWGEKTNDLYWLFSIQIIIVTLWCFHNNNILIFVFVSCYEIRFKRLSNIQLSG